METIRLFDADAYASEFTARVISCNPAPEAMARTETDKIYEVVLDKTLFFPEQGGQSPDKGNIEGFEVINVQIKDGIITHYVNLFYSLPFEPGREVSGKIDWKYRFSNMQQHSGEHIFSGLVHKRFGFENVGFHLSDHVVTMDFNGVLTPENVAEIEREVNRVIAENVPVTASFPSREELSALDFRSKKEIEGQVRLITIEGYDVCACCAPHVRHTGEIGSLKVMTMQNFRGGVRISILCGLRALEAFCEKSKIVSDLTGLLTTSQDRLYEVVNRLKTEKQSLSTELAKTKQALMLLELEAVPAEQKDVILFEEEIDPNVARNVVNGLTAKHSGCCAVFAGRDDTSYRYILGSASLDCSAIAKTLREKLGAKGGGSKEMIQGTVSARKEDILMLLQNR